MSLRLQIECDPAEWDQRKSIQDLKSQTYKPESNTYVTNTLIKQTLAD